MNFDNSETYSLLKAGTTGKVVGDISVVVFSDSFSIVLQTIMEELGPLSLSICANFGVPFKY